MDYYELMNKCEQKLNEALRARYQRPDFVMMHTLTKDIIEFEYSKKIDPAKTYRIMGMKVIFTESINPDEVICTFLPE